MMMASPELNSLCTWEIKQVRNGCETDSQPDPHVCGRPVRTSLDTPRNPSLLQHDLDLNSLKVPSDKSDCQVTP